MPPDTDETSLITRETSQVISYDEAISDNNAGAEEPSFEVDPVQLQFELDHKLRQLCVKSNIMFLVLDKSIFKIDLDNPAIVKRFQFASDAIMSNSWLSPDGQHFVVQVNGTSYFYLHNSYDKFKVLPRLKGLEIEDIVFPHKTSQSHFDNVSTGDFFIITKENIVLLANIKSHFGQDNKKDDKYLKQTYKCADKITGLCLSNNSTRIEIFTPSSILQWDCFELSVNEILRVFKSDPKIIKLRGSGDAVLESSDSSYVLLSAHTNNLVTNDSELTLSKLSKLNPLVKLSNKFVLTNHHILVLSQSHSDLIVFSKLSNSPPKVIKLPQQVSNITADYISHTYWLYGKNAIYEILIENESVKVWYDFYKMGKYEEAIKALELSESKEKPLRANMVLTKQGYEYLQKGAFGLNFNKKFDSSLIALQIKGLQILANSAEPFEKICLMLMNLHNSDSTDLNSTISQKLLVEYLLVKFDQVKKENNKIRIVVISSWIIELMLRNIYNLEDEQNSINTTIGTKNGVDDDKAKYSKEMNSDFIKFFDSNYKLFDKDTVYQIMSELNYQSKLIHYAELNHDYEFILNYCADLEDWSGCLQILVKMYSANVPSFESALMRTASVLLLNYPGPTTETWLKFANVDYKKLLSSLLVYNKKYSATVSAFDNYSLIFLSKLIFQKNIKERVVNNYYLSLLITYPTHSQGPEETDIESKYINKQILKLLNYIRLNPKLYDSGFILRLCLDNNHIQPAVIILIHDLKLFEQALKLAIDSDLTELAISVLERFNKYIDNNLEDGDDDTLDLDVNQNPLSEYPNKFVDISKNKLHHKDFTQGKKLWVMFAKYLIEGVMNNKEFEILGNVHGDLESEENGDGHTSSENEDIVKDLTNVLAGQAVKPVDHSPITSKKANRVLRYLLDSSFNATINSSFVNLRDLLQLFPESVMVNNFKDEIIRSLNQYNNKINQLSIEMKESLLISNKLNNQIQESNDRIKKGKIFTIVEPGEPCCFCNKLLISKNFVVFPNCHHGFHKECLVKYYLMIKGDYRFKRFFQNFKKQNGGGNKKELDDIMLRECVLCNESNILTIDNNLVDPIKDKAAIDEWEL
ncbi:tethering complex subunit [Yamadazyma tenuis]|uniref:Uncharacterized protein n=1 Tax=Candida tenuis (strain ATCC 10573 / BCRC 21748 / CBS 615 / JCM 9827 / NBRC 10315 / NRRL Y-1498 / VKM Y-70) TaxID=590646 RepID=G3B479_CANTC|nr:uncharacterized protein CANTEDRAFT_105815 [Yamadazyma tenuis ATCC 10573]EGV63916.1 hypothetical protein CANTEDRAFT_105815 [Yamadazyma tenuis ATCC 10573]WEJ96466.1 tethering complex subunit [Yamadazyma tenuis]